MKKTAAARTVGHHHHHAKPSHAHGGSSSGGKGAKGAGSNKHTHTRKHHPKKHVKRGLALGSAVACCAAEALAASLRLTGREISDEDVLALYWRTASDPDAGASILATLEVAAEFGIAGVRLVSFRPFHVQDDVPLPVRQGHADNFGELDHVLGRGCHVTSVILGLELPGPHTVLEHGGRWWSWGEPYDPASFPDAVIEEAWAITWP